MTDQTGAAIPGVALTATNIDTGISMVRVTGSDGNYLFPFLAPGHYRLNAVKRGFASKNLSGITLLVNQQARVNVQLAVGAVATQVQVQGKTPLVETSTASLGTVVGEREVEDYPLNFRYDVALATLVPGAAPDASTGYASLGLVGGSSPFGTDAYTAGGGRDSSNTLLIDGMESRAWTTGSIALQPPPDATREFKIQGLSHSNVVPTPPERQGDFSPRSRENRASHLHPRPKMCADSAG